MITATMASIACRESAMLRVVASLSPQVDRVRVYLNDYYAAPLCGLHNVEFVLHPFGDLGDAGKFAFDVEGYHLSCDDDIVYPPNYAEMMVAAVERYDRQVVCSIHGARVRTPIKSYYRGGRTVYHCRHDLLADTPAHILGTGVMAYHTDLVRFDGRAFGNGFMADIWVGLQLQERKIPAVCLAHWQGWLEVLNVPRTIAAEYRNRDSVQTRTVNSRQWSVYEVRRPHSNV